MHPQTRICFGVLLTLLISFQNFDTQSTAQFSVPITNFSPGSWAGGVFDAVRLVKNGKVLLVSDDSTGSVLVFTSSDGWNNATYAGSVTLNVAGGTPTYTFEMNSVV